MLFPDLQESIRLADLPGIAAVVRPVITLDERRVDRPADLREVQRDHRAELDDPGFVLPLGDHDVVQAVRQGPIMGGRTAGNTCLSSQL